MARRLRVGRPSGDSEFQKAYKRGIEQGKQDALEQYSKDMKEIFTNIALMQQTIEYLDVFSKGFVTAATPHISSIRGPIGSGSRDLDGHLTDTVTLRLENDKGEERYFSLTELVGTKIKVTDIIYGAKREATIPEPNLIVDVTRIVKAGDDILKRLESSLTQLLSETDEKIRNARMNQPVEWEDYDAQDRN